MQRTKKSISESNRAKIIQSKISHYIEERIRAEEEYCQSFQEYLTINGLCSYFHNLHDHLQSDMFLETKKHSVIEDGVYVLLQGSVVYTWVKNKNDRGRREHLFSLATIGSFSNLCEGSADRDLLLANGYSILICQPFSVIECQNGNIAAYDDSILLKIPQKVLQLTEYQKLKVKREQAFSNAKLPQVRFSPTESPVTLNCNLHHTFRTKKFVFRSKFQVQTLGIIINGCIIMKRALGQKVELSRFSLILPQIQFQVASAEVEIIEVIHNPTVTWVKPLLINQIIEYSKQKVKKETEVEQKSEVRKYRKKINASISMYKVQNDINLLKENKKKKKDCSLFAKQSQDYWIVSSQFCKQNLRNIRQRKSKIPDGTKKPIVLFNISKKLRKSENQCQGGASELENRSSLKQHNTNRHTLMQRYQNYSKGLFEQYQKFKEKEKKKKNKLRFSNQFQKWRS